MRSSDTPDLPCSYVRVLHRHEIRTSSSFQTQSIVQFMALVLLVQLNFILATNLSQVFSTRLATTTATAQHLATRDNMRLQLRQPLLSSVCILISLHQQMLVRFRRASDELKHKNRPPASRASGTLDESRKESPKSSGTAASQKGKRLRK